MLASFQSVIARDLTDSCSITYLLSIQSLTKLKNFHFSFYKINIKNVFNVAEVTSVQTNFSTKQKRSPVRPVH
jgi:hypothetical protein